MQSSPSSFPSSFFTIHLLSSLSFYWLNTWIFLPAYPIFMDMSESLKQAFVNSVQFSHSVVSNSLPPHGLQHNRLPCPSPTPRAYLKSCPSSRWCHPIISSSVILFSFCPQSLPALGSFQKCQLSTSSGQSIGVSASASVLPMNIQDWFPLGWTSWISLPSKGLSRVFSNTFFKSISSSVLSLLYSPAFTSIHDCWKNHSFD